MLNMNHFKEEFSYLLLRYASAEATNNNNVPENCTPLTNLQILDGVKEVLRKTLSIDLQHVEPSTMKTPVNEIVVTTPDAPDVLRMDYNQTNVLHNKFKSLDSATEEKNSFDFDNFKSTSFIHTPTEIGTPSIDKPFLELGINKNLESLEQKFKEIPKFDTAKNMTMYSMVEDAHKDVMKVVHKLEDLRELLLPEARPIRRLSAIMNLPKSQQQQSSSSASNNLRTTQRAKALTRRSMGQLNEELSVTPTSSRPSLVMPPSSLQGKKASAGTGVTPKPLSKLSQQTRSVSTLSLLTDTNKSAGSGASTSKSPSKKNSKYAHVQSTIPKPTSSAVKRKV
ncbi:hypothetical protein TSAR_002886 [Trichomalopsis sarcophagae]|uniref:Uncharacterized protein n=1 Tax=Trichomalopsis sarcophagae TaxID=543379 RepID=A0A232EIB9_9HYME|nr:hypothetical protein TSAR_002886 [Trichomalopsis sarcophagae]